MARQRQSSAQERDPWLSCIHLSMCTWKPAGGLATSGRAGGGPDPIQTHTKPSASATSSESMAMPGTCAVEGMLVHTPSPLYRQP